MYDDFIIQALERLKKGRHSSSDLNSIVNYLSSGGDVDILRPLLSSTDTGLLTDAVYILSEIGSAGAPLLDQALKFGDHRDEQIRYWALNSVMTCSTRQEVEKFIRNSELDKDTSDIIRNKAERYLNTQSQKGDGN